jgi:hypothetical protein
MKWIAANHPELAGRYRRLYGTGSYASKEYRTWLAGKVRYFKARYGFTHSSGFSHRDLDDPRAEEAAYPAGSIPTAVPGGPLAGSPAMTSSVSGTAVQDSLF